MLEMHSAVLISFAKLPVFPWLVLVGSQAVDLQNCNARIPIRVALPWSWVRSAQLPSLCAIPRLPGVHSRPFCALGESQCQTFSVTLESKPSCPYLVRVPEACKLNKQKRREFFLPGPFPHCLLYYGQEFNVTSWYNVHDCI